MYEVPFLLLCSEEFSGGTTIFWSQVQSLKDQNLVVRAQDLLAKHRHRAVMLPNAAKPAVVPAPAQPVPVPTETTDTEIAISVAVNRPPEGHNLSFPAFRDEMRMSQIEVQEVGATYRLVFELLTEFITIDYAILLPLGQVESHFRGIKFELTTFDVAQSAIIIFRHTPAVGNEGVGIEH